MACSLLISQESKCYTQANIGRYSYYTVCLLFRQMELSKFRASKSEQKYGHQHVLFQISYIYLPPAVHAKAIHVNYSSQCYPLHNELNASLRFHKNKKNFMPHNSHKGMQQYRHLVTLISSKQPLNHQPQLTSYSSTQKLFNYKLC